MARLGYEAMSGGPCSHGQAWRGGAILTSYFFLPAPGAKLANPLAPVSIDYMYGFSDTAAQTWMLGWAWVVFLMVAPPVVIYLPTHFWRKRYAPVAVLD